jgi:hypothetical protein
MGILVRVDELVAGFMVGGTWAAALVLLMTVINLVPTALP